jgi:hypothetical protein
MDLSNQLQDILRYIESADINSWLNIPYPIIQFLSNVQQVIKLQSRISLKNTSDINKVSTSLDKRITKLSSAMISSAEINSMIDAKCTEVLKTVDDNISEMEYKIVTQLERKIKEEGEWAKEKINTLDSTMKTRFSMVHGQIDSSKDAIIQLVKTKAIPEALQKFAEENNRK